MCGEKLGRMSGVCILMTKACLVLINNALNLWIKVVAKVVGLGRGTYAA